VNKKLLTALFIISFSSLVSAQGVTPAEGAEINKTYNESIVNVSGLNSNYFEVQVDNDTVLIDSGYQTPKGDYSAEVSFNNSSDSIDFTVNQFNNWTVTPQKFNKSLSIASSGQLGNMTIKGLGNSFPEVNIGVTGNISSFVSVLDSTKFIPLNGTRPVNLVYDIPRDKRFGNYTGNITFNSSIGDNVSVPIHLSLVDDINPVIESLKVDDIMATNTGSVDAEVFDNIGVSQVNVSVYREEVVSSNNSTSVEKVVIKNESKNFTGTDFSTSFSDTDVIGKYFVTLSVKDESGNKVSKVTSFNIEGLDSITVLESNFKFSDMRPVTDENPDRKGSVKVFRKSDDNALGLSLSNFTHRKENSSIEVEIRRDGQANGEFLYRNGEKKSVEITRSGTYLLEVESDTEGDSFSGNLVLDPVEQHIDFDKVLDFRGLVVDPEYPELPEQKRLGDFNGSLSFIKNDNDVVQGIRYEGIQYDISSCKGAESWSNCIPGFTLGELEKSRSEIESLNSYLTWYKRGLGFMVLVFIFGRLNFYAASTRELEEKIEKSKIGNVYESLDQVEV